MLSVVIPTLQKNVTVFFKLLDNLSNDKSVSEIIVIDNSLKGLDYNSPKLRVIIPKENLYVNPSWNLGVKEAKSEIIGLLNDDISIPENFCSDIIAKMDKTMGIIGMNSGDYIETKDIIGEPPQKTDLFLEKTKYMDLFFGVALFCYKETYPKIPDEIKIVYGDVWLYYQYKKQKKDNYRICGQKIYHLGSLSSSSINFNPICKKDAYLYKKLMVKWYNRLFSYEETWKGYKLRLCGLTFFIPKKNAKGYINE